MRSTRNSIALADLWKLEAALAAAFLVSLAILVLGPITVACIIAGTTMLVLTFVNAEIVILVLLCFVLGLIPARYNPSVDLVVGHLQLSDLLLAWLLSASLLLVLADGTVRRIRSQLDVPLLTFYVAVILGLVRSVKGFGVQFSDATYEARLLAHYLVFFAVTRLVRKGKQLVRLTRGCYLVGAVIATVMVAQAMAGRTLLLMEESYLWGDTDVFRVSHPGVAAVFVALIGLTCQVCLIKDGRRGFANSFVVLLLGMGLLVTITRNPIIAGAVSIVGLMIAVPGRLIGEMITRVFIAAVLLAAALAALVLWGPAGVAYRVSAYGDALAERLSRMISPEILSHGENLVPRWIELRYAWARIKQHPIIGIGLWTSYRSPSSSSDQLTWFIHNAYIWLWLKTGLLGLASFLWLSARFLVSTFRNWRMAQDESLRAASLGFGLAYLGLMVSNLVAPLFVQDCALAIFGVMLGINEVVFSEPVTAIEGGGSDDSKGSAVSEAGGAHTAQGRVASR